MADNDRNTDEQIQSDDLDLVKDELEDEGKDDAALWEEFSQSEKADDGGDGSAGDESADAERWQSSAEDDGDDDQGAATRKSDSDDASSSDDDESDDGDDQQSPDDHQAQDDIWANATDEQKQAYEALQDKERRVRMQVSALNRKLEEARRGDQAAAPDTGGAASDDDSGAREGGDSKFFQSEEWKTFEEEYPEVAGPMAKVVGDMQQRLVQQGKELSAIGDDRRQAAFEEQESLLEETHADWQTVLDDNADTLETWLAEQPRHIQEAAIRNADVIVDAAEAADVVGRFKEHLGMGKGSNERSQESGQQQDSRGKDNNRSSGKRQRQLESAASTRSRGPGTSAGIPEDGDEQAIWDAFDKVEAARG